MMQPSSHSHLVASSSSPRKAVATTTTTTTPSSSIFDAIKDGDWEGLLALYATTVYAAVHSAEFARRGSGVGGSGSSGGGVPRRGGLHRSHSLPLTATTTTTMMATGGSGGPRRGVFIEGEFLFSLRSNNSMVFLLVCIYMPPATDPTHIVVSIYNMMSSFVFSREETRRISWSYLPSFYWSQQLFRYYYLIGSLGTGTNCS